MNISLLIKAVQDVGINNKHNPMTFYDLVKVLRHYRALQKGKDEKDQQFFENLDNSLGTND